MEIDRNCQVNQLHIDNIQIIHTVDLFGMYFNCSNKEFLKVFKADGSNWYLQLLSWCTRTSTAIHRRTLARSLTLPTLQVAEDFALPAATASFSLWFTVPLLAAKHFWLLALSCGTACHRRLRRHRLWRSSALDSRRYCLLNHPDIWLS